jgi:hypothetical protein
MAFVQIQIRRLIDGAEGPCRWIEFLLPLMATPALSEGVMYVRSSRTLFAIGSHQ